MDIRHSKSQANIMTKNRQQFRKNQQSQQSNNFSTDQMKESPSQTNNCNLKNLKSNTSPDQQNSNSQILNSLHFQSARMSKNLVYSSNAEQIKSIILENEKLKESINQKQYIIDTLTLSKKKYQPKIELHELVYKNNFRSIIQPQSQQECKKSKTESKQSVSQNNNKRTYLPKIQCFTQEDECNFTFANNFFKDNITCSNAQKIDFKQVFAQSHLRKKFYT